MCLTAYLDKPKDENIFKFDKDGYTYCYKSYRYNNRSRGVPFLSPIWKGKKVHIKPGLIKSNRRTTKVLISTDSTYKIFNELIISRGIHVYVDLISVKWNFYSLVRVRCHRDDLVATSRDGSSAVFNKVFLEEKEYNFSLKKKNTIKQLT